MKELNKHFLANKNSNTSCEKAGNQAKNTNLGQEKDNVKNENRKISLGCLRRENTTLVQWIGQLNGNKKRGTSFNGIFRQNFK